MDLSDHHATIAGVNLLGTAPQEARGAFDCAWSALVYAYFDYDLLVVGEIQSFGAFELALEASSEWPRWSIQRDLRNLVDRARKAGIFPPKLPAGQEFTDSIEALIALRNGLSHGTSEIHSPGMGVDGLGGLRNRNRHRLPSLIQTFVHGKSRPAALCCLLGASGSQVSKARRLSIAWPRRALQVQSVYLRSSRGHGADAERWIGGWDKIQRG